jgi:hypothetical protein
MGEPFAPLVTDLGVYYPAYSGQNPWSGTAFLNGGAGAITDKMERPLTTDFVHGTQLTAAMICPLYAYCYGPDEHIFSDNACTNEHYIFNGRTLTQPGQYIDTLSNFNGCDSVVKLTLSFYPPDTTSLSGILCNGYPYNFNGMQILSPGNYRDTLNDVHGCDSTLMLHLTLHYTSAYAYTDEGCEGGIYDFNGQSLTASGIYQDTITNASGCDSVITLTLAMDTAAVITWNSNTDTVLPHSTDILLNATPAGGVYSGTGVNGNIFFPDSAAYGANVITYTFSNGCTSTVTRTYYLVYPEGINEVSIADQISLYPNPANEMLIARSGLFNNYESMPIVTDITGQIVSIRSEIQVDKITLHIEGLSPGMYMIRFNVNGEVVTKKFAKGE